VGLRRFRFCSLLLAVHFARRILHKFLCIFEFGNDHHIDIAFSMDVQVFALEKIYRNHAENLLAVCNEVCVLFNEGGRIFSANTRSLQFHKGRAR
jgi:hypothetical protein